jgi:microsomal dipeptidase-like Zn-dependent dipeptidase
MREGVSAGAPRAPPTVAPHSSVARTAAGPFHVLEWAVPIAGFDRVGLGSDLDGGFGRAELPADIQSPTDYARLLDGLERAGFMASGGTRAGFAHGNLGRVVDSSGCLS